MKDVKYSVIIPHYNSPESLKILLGTIPKRTDVQVIVVDDNSTQGAELLSRVIEEDGRCGFYTNASGVQSAGACRNIGLRHKTGKWVVFADADDYFLPGFMDVLDTFYDSPADLILFTPVSIDLSTGKETSRHMMYAGLIKNYKKAVSKQPPDKRAGRAAAKRIKTNENNLKYRFVVPWSKMIRAEMIDRHNIEFEEIRNADDMVFCTKVALYAKSVQATSKTIYCVTKDGKASGKATLTTTVDEGHLDVKIGALIRRCNLLREHLPENEMKRLDISGMLLLSESLRQFGIRKFARTARIFRHNNVRLFKLSLFNIKLAMKKI